MRMSNIWDTSTVDGLHSCKDNMMFDRDEKLDPDWAHVAFSYVLPLRFPFDGYHALHVVGTFRNMFTWILLNTTPLRMRKTRF